MHHVRRSARPVWRNWGQSKAACELLARVYEWFTEDFDALNLKEATEREGGGNDPSLIYRRHASRRRLVKES